MMAEKSRRWIIIAIIVAVILFLVAAYWLFDPSRFIFPRCPVFVLTGWECPGCGSQRALHALLHGDIAGAWHYNAFLICLAPVVALLLFSEYYRERYPRLHRVMTGRVAAIVLGVLLFGWTIYRNLR